MDELEKKLEEALTCPVCQDIFTDPKQLPCGHTMCMGCLENLRDHSMTTPFRCPNCREFFGPVIGISKSFTLTSVAEEFQMAVSRKGGPDRNIYCDSCPDKHRLAAKTCVKCEVSLCPEHLKEHIERPAFAKHLLVKPLANIVNRKCPVHTDEVGRNYCSESRSYICNLCTLERNQQNMTKALSALHQSQLAEHLIPLNIRLEMMQNHLRESRQSIKTLQEDINHERQVKVRLEPPLRENGGIVDCFKTLTQVSQLICEEKETVKQKTYPPESPINSVTIVLLCLWLMVLSYAYNHSVENQTLKTEQKNLQNRIDNLYSSIAEQFVDLPINSNFPLLTKDEGVLMLDLDTANDYITVSNDFRTARKVRNRIGYPSNPKRFNDAPQVLSAHCFHTGAHVWEVNVEGYWDVAVSYRSIKNEKHSRSAFGNNLHSWSLTSNGSGKLIAYHDGKKTVTSATLQSNRVAVMVDIEKGNITFASLGSTVTRLHEFKAKLTEPVCLGFGLYRIDPASIASIVKAQ